MDELNSNQTRRRGRWAPTEVRQSVLSRGQIRHRQRDRHDRRRNALRAQRSQGVPPAPSSHATESLVEQSPLTTAVDLRSQNIIRLENIFKTSNDMFGPEASIGDQTLRKYMAWGSQIVGSLNYEAIVRHVEMVLALTYPNLCPVNTNEQIQDPTIPPEIYRLLQKMKINKGGKTLISSIREAFHLLELKQYFSTETSRQISLCSSGCGNCMARAIEDVKLDFACANSGLSRKGLLILREASQRDYAVVVGHIDKLCQGGNAIQDYVDEIGTPAALIILPFRDTQRVTGLPLHQHAVAFVSGMIQFIEGSCEFPAIQDLINHVSVWFDGWIRGVVEPHVARGYFNRFIESGTSPDDDFGSLSMSHVLTSFVGTWKLRGLSIPTVGRPGNEFTFEDMADLRAFRPTYRLNERLIAGVLATTDLPLNVTCGRATLYGSCHDDRTFMTNKAMAINPKAATILCPVHTGMSDHWVGVVVRLIRKDAERPTMTLELLDSHVHEAGVSLYDERIVMEMILAWLRHRLPDYGNFVVPCSMAYGRVVKEAAMNSCGMHTLANLISVGRSSDYPTDSSGEWVDAQRYQYLTQILRSATNNLKLEPGRDFIKATLIKFVDDYKQPGQW